MMNRGFPISFKACTDVDDPYEQPKHPELMIETDEEMNEESIARIIARLEELGYLEPEEMYEEDVGIFRDRLITLGYL